MLYALAWSPCAVCKKPFGYNPKRVPSITIKGIKQGICKECIEMANEVFREKNEPEFQIHPDAYGAIKTEELGY
jgi:hypothetical protein